MAVEGGAAAAAEERGEAARNMGRLGIRNPHQVSGCSSRLLGKRGRRKRRRPRKVVVAMAVAAQLHPPPRLRRCRGRQ